MSIKSKKKTVFILMIVILIIQLILSLYFCGRKKSLFIDEVLSFSLANHKGGGFVDIPYNEWQDEQWYINSRSAVSDHCFEYSIPYNNQKSDVHPPLYYFFLHTSSSFMPDKVSYWAGFVWNILFFLGTSITLYFLSYEIYKSRKCSLLIMFLYGISFGALNSVIFIRMYMLMTFILLLHIWIYVKYMKCERIPGKAYFFLYLTLVCGALTQYYFLIAAFWCGLWYTFHFLFQKNFRELLKYWGTIALSAITSLGIFPSMWEHIFNGYRGEEAISNFVSSDGYLDKIKSMLSIINQQLFGNKLWLIIIGMLILFVGCCLKHEHILGDFKKSGFLFFVIAGYLLLVTKVAPYQTDRYIMAIYPLIYLLVIGMIYDWGTKCAPSNAVLIICLLLLSGLSVSQLCSTELPYEYNESTAERRLISEEYKDYLCIYLCDPENDYYRSQDMQVLKNYKGFYYLNYTGDWDTIMNDMERIKKEKHVVLYLDKLWNTEAAKRVMGTFMDERWMNDIVELDEDIPWTVYLMSNPEI